MRIDVLTIFPEMFAGPLSTSIIGIAQDKGLLDVEVHDIRDWTHDKHRTTDDTSYGGGPGMVMKPEPIFESVRAVREMDPRTPHVVFLTPVGEVLDQRLAQELSDHDRVLFVCGRYEGFDERTFTLADRLLSIGDYVLTGGELPAMVTIDAVARLLPGVLGHEDSTADESFMDGLLEYPQYTRPPEFEGMTVPEILRSGDHAKIALWRREQAVRRTARTRPDLLGKIELTAHEREIVEDEMNRSDTRG